MQSVNCNSSIFFTIVQQKDKGEMENAKNDCNALDLNDDDITACGLWQQ